MARGQAPWGSNKWGSSRRLIVISQYDRMQIASVFLTRRMLTPGSHAAPAQERARILLLAQLQVEDMDSAAKEIVKQRHLQFREGGQRRSGCEC